MYVKTYIQYMKVLFLDQSLGIVIKLDTRLVVCRTRNGFRMRSNLLKNIFLMFCNDVNLQFRNVGTEKKLEL